MKRFDLPAYVRACVTGETLILLDLRHDRYLSLPAGSQTAGEGGGPVQALHVDEGVSAALCAKGITPGPNARRPRPVGWLSRWRGLYVADELAVLAALAWARRVVDAKRLEGAVWELCADKELIAEDDRREPDALVALFNARRVWALGRRACLYNALALTRLLLSRGVAADFVIGVRTSPFLAHSWVEWRGQVLCDDPEVCVAFTEILRV